MKARIILFSLIFGLARPVRAYPDAVFDSLTLAAPGRAAALSANERFAYVIGPEQLMVVDAFRWRQARVVDVAGVPQSVARVGDDLYLTTDVADRLLRFSLAVPSRPTLEETIVLGTSAQKFTQIHAVDVAGGAALVMLSQQGRIYAFDLAAGELIANGSTRYIDPGYDVADLAPMPDGRFAVLGKAGQLRTYAVATLSAVASATLGTSGDLFSRAFFDALPAGTYGFITRASSGGELWSAHATTGGTLIPGGPAAAGEGASAVVVMDVARPQSGSGMVRYAYVASPGDQNAKVYPAATVGAASFAAIDTIAGVGEIAKQGWLAAPTGGYLHFLAAAEFGTLSDQPRVTVAGLPAQIDTGGDATANVKATRGGELNVVRYTGAETDAMDAAHGKTLTTETLAANVARSVEIPTEDFEEGGNLVAFFLRSGDYSGRAAVLVNKDTVPAAPRGFRLAFGNEKIFVDWDRSPEKDIDHYLISFGTAAAEGGVAGLASPIEVDDSGDTRRTLRGVPNGTAVRVKLAAVDRTGHQSPWTPVLRETAEETVGLRELIGEAGGCQAGTPASLLAPWLLSIGGLRCARKRRS